MHHDCKEEGGMKAAIPMSLVGAALAVCLAAGSAQAAPAASVLDTVKPMTAQSQSLVQQARCHWVKRCWRRHHHRHCKRVRRCH
jgi:hypothetical protein